jgi:hypothetical protein
MVVLYRKLGSTDWHLDTRSPAVRNRRRDICVSRETEDGIFVYRFENVIVSWFSKMVAWWPYLKYDQADIW